MRGKVMRMKAMVQQQKIENVPIAVSLDTKRRIAESLSGGRRSEVRGRSEDQKRENDTNAVEKGHTAKDCSSIGLTGVGGSEVQAGATLSMDVPQTLRYS